MKEEKKYSGSKTRNYFTAYLLASIQGRRLRYLEKQQKILFAEENLEDKEITDIDISLEERLELEKKEQLLLDESKHSKELVDMAQNESTYSNAGNQSVQYAIRTVTQYIYKFGKEVGIY